MRWGLRVGVNPSHAAVARAVGMDGGPSGRRRGLGGAPPWVPRATRDALAALVKRAAGDEADAARARALGRPSGGPEGLGLPQLDLTEGRRSAVGVVVAARDDGAGTHEVVRALAALGERESDAGAGKVVQRTCVSVGGVRFVVVEVRGGVAETVRGRARQRAAVRRALRAEGVRGARAALGVVVERRNAVGRRWGRGDGPCVAERVADVLEDACGWIRVVAVQNDGHAVDGVAAETEAETEDDGGPRTARTVLRKIRRELATAGVADEEGDGEGDGMATVVVGKARGWAGVVLFAALAAAAKDAWGASTRQDTRRLGKVRDVVWAALRQIPGFEGGVRRAGGTFLGRASQGSGLEAAAVAVAAVADLPAVLDRRSRMVAWPAAPGGTGVRFAASPAEGCAKCQVSADAGARAHVVVGTRADVDMFSGDDARPPVVRHGARLEAAPLLAAAHWGGDHLSCLGAIQGGLPGDHTAELFVLHGAPRGRVASSVSASTVLGVGFADARRPTLSPPLLPRDGRALEKDAAVCLWLKASEREPAAALNLELCSLPGKSEGEDFGNGNGNGYGRGKGRGGWARRALAGTTATLGLTIHVLRSLSDVVMNCSARVPVRKGAASLEPALCMSGRGTGVLSLGFHAPAETP